MSKYIFQTGGENDDFFNNYVDALLKSQDSQQTQQEDLPVDEESDYIKNLRAYDEENSKTTKEEEYNKRFDDLQSLLDTKLSEFQSKLSEYDWFQDDDGGVKELTDMYDTRNTNVPYNPTIGNSTKSITPGSGGKARNNYGNIRDVKTGTFRSFNSPEEGRAALENQLNIYKTNRSRTGVKANSTLYEAMAKYAPAADRNNPKKYAEFIANKIGISPNTPISQVPTKQWADAIAIMEGNKNIDR